ncbi:MAG TPA: TlpA disulfide reductase family protein [Bryobacteraceae bacterium]|nr:TlpA disulfide reductase family protein [Bryobacteraceae bacterium]
MIAHQPETGVEPARASRTPGARTARLDWVLRAGIIVLSVALVYVLYAAIHERVVVAGDKAPAFTITTDDGHQISVPNFGGKLLVLNFWASWCAPCVEETPSLSEFARRYAGKGVIVLGVSVDRDASAYQKFLQHFRPAFLTARDSKIHEDYGTYIYPETYFIDSSGRVVRKLDVAGIDFTDPKMLSFVDSLL